MSEHRRQIRVAKNLLAKIIQPTRECFGFVHDVAKTGLGVAVSSNIEMGDHMEIHLNVPKLPSMKLSGDVVWRRELPRIAKHRFLLGVRLTETCPAYDEWVEEQIRYDYERREHPRYQAIVEVNGSDVFDLLDAATTNVSARGLYVRTSMPLPVGSHHELALRSPALDEPVMCLAEVVSSFECEPDELDHAHGAGMRIISFKKDHEERFVEFIKQLDALYRFHWPQMDGVEPTAHDDAESTEEVEILVESA
ncbi:PilZ domain-containing protein [bacterium]|nr:PilZ domain-containing protein [bacterium]